VVQPRAWKLSIVTSSLLGTRSSPIPCRGSWRPLPQANTGLTMETSRVRGDLDAPPQRSEPRASLGRNAPDPRRTTTDGTGLPNELVFELPNPEKPRGPGRAPTLPHRAPHGPSTDLVHGDLPSRPGRRRAARGSRGGVGRRPRTEEFDSSCPRAGARKKRNRKLTQEEERRARRNPTTSPRPTRLRKSS
jgi:hypothetical protein